MQTENQFTLTLREEDLLEIYKDAFEFKLFSRENYYRISFVLLFLWLMILWTLGLFFNQRDYIMLLIFILGAGYNCIEIVRKYWAVRAKEKEVKKWIDSLRSYKTHRINTGNQKVRYLRDNDVFVYEIDKIKTTTQNDSYFFCSLIDGEDLLLPAKSFAPGEYEKFKEAFNKMMETTNNKV